MGVRFSQDVEQEERELRRVAHQESADFSWEYYRTTSLVEVVHKAKEMGWFYKKVQVRQEVVGEDVIEYVLEPYESGCSCRGLLKYSDFFEPPIKNK